MVLLDPPHNEWPIAATVFEELPRICPNGFLICFCRILDIPELLQIARWENISLFDSLIWHDPQPTFVHTTRALRNHEHILIFKNGNPETPNMQMGEINATMKPINKGQSSLGKWRGGQRTYSPKERKQMTSVLKFARPLNGPLGRWQKPKSLIEILVKAYCKIGGVILDPFGGSGTTGQVAIENGRNAILLELNPEYVKLAEQRIASTQPPLFTQ